MKPKPLVALNHFTVPVVMTISFQSYVSFRREHDVHDKGSKLKGSIVAAPRRTRENLAVQNQISFSRGSCLLQGLPRRFSRIAHEFVVKAPGIARRTPGTDASCRKGVSAPLPA